ncbi:MAG TPA: TylF/MycF/NovP-related O-methyltransferase [Chitinophagaceae bacterium]|nr:TylF/MycF/NovP-related O-methyltransferase [Chitinophagaceae bacterium]
MIKFIAKAFLRICGRSLQKSNVFITGSLEYLQRERTIPKTYFDYVRLSTLEMVSSQIKEQNIPGSIAEVGVFRGDFAKFINQYFPDRTFYLFDTFEGFDDRDIATEKNNAFSEGDQDFSNTSVEIVLKKMPNPGVCLPKKGYFPETAKDINDRFVFVSLDTDLFAPIYEGLNFFYPRLVKGGYIFVHDFNNDAYKGARKAVEQFCAEQHVGYVPIPDICGTCIITK